MKQLKLAVIALFTLVTVSSVNAQDSENPWTFGLGFNAIDFRTTTGLGDIAEDYFGTSDWNTSRFLSRISAGKYIDHGITVEAAFSVNRITSIYAKNDSENKYYALDLNAKYDLNELFGETDWFDPHAIAGFSYAYLDGDSSEGQLTFNIGVGFNTWFSDSFGLNFQTVAKRRLGDKVPDHFQHSLGVVFRFDQSN